MTSRNERLTHLENTVSSQSTHPRNHLQDLKWTVFMIKRWEEIQTSKERLVPTLETELSIKAALFRGAQSSPAVRGSMIGHLIPSLAFSYLISQHHGAGGSLVPIFLRRRLWHGKVKYTHFF